MNRVLESVSIRRHPPTGRCSRKCLFHWIHSLPYPTL